MGEQDGRSGMVEDVPGGATEQHLADTGVAVAAHDQEVGLLLARLGQVTEERADLLVMGGYGHSRVREMMFGGVTRSILESTACPILVSH